jgi:hypothetical protein
MAKYEQRYILHNEPAKVSPHLTFGAMAHEVLYKAGILRDEVRDNVASTDYSTIIPSEVLHQDLKNEFQILNWQAYFKPIIKQVAKYEQDCIKELGENVQIEREIKLQLTVEELHHLGYYNVQQPLVGIVDLLLYTPTSAIILDYKFANKKKTQDNFDLDSQLPLYAFMVHILYDIPLHNIQYGYIDIPKEMSSMPIVLSNGTLSRSKSQNVTQDDYKKAVDTVHENDKYYNCEPGGYYHDCWCNLAHNKPAYLSKQFLDIDVYTNVTDALFKTAGLIDVMLKDKLPFVQKFDAYSCQNCEYLNYCKSYLTEVF